MRLTSPVPWLCTLWLASACSPARAVIQLISHPANVPVTGSGTHSGRWLVADWDISVVESGGVGGTITQVVGVAFDTTGAPLNSSEFTFYDSSGRFLRRPLRLEPRARVTFHVTWGGPILSDYCLMPSCPDAHFYPRPGPLKFLITVRVLDDRGEMHDETLELREG